jgi:1,2-diacylglycerol 3-alpha-glucosyltransferase
MRIAFFTDTYKPQINGVVTSIKLAAENLRKNGHEVYIFCPSGFKDEYVYQIYSKKFRNYPEYKVSFPFFDVIKKIEDIKPDIIHIHTPAIIGATGLFIGKLLNIPIVTTYHTILKDYMGYITSDELGDKFTDMYTSWFFNKFPTIIVPTNPIKKFLIESGVRKPIKVVPASIDIKIIGKRQKRNKRLTILHVGRLCKEKRIDIVLRSFKEVLEKIDAILIVTSSGPNERRLKSLAKSLGISKNVRFTGYISLEELKRLYSSADIFVSASDTETQGLVVLEAMANGCPVIARNALGFKGVIENYKNGLLFDEESELSEKIMLLTNRKLRDKIVREGLKTARKFNSENYVKEIEKIYRENLKFGNNEIMVRFLYGCFLILNFNIYWFIKNTDLTINSRSINLYLRFIRIMLSFEKLVNHQVI